MKDAAFAILHEGSIRKITGIVPGTVFIEIQCDYLRQRLSTPGHRFIIKLENCTTFFSTDKRGVKVSAFDKIAIENPVILSADISKNSGSEQVLVICEHSIITLAFSSFTIYLNDSAYSKDSASLKDSVYLKDSGYLKDSAYLKDSVYLNELAYSSESGCFNQTPPKTDATTVDTITIQELDQLASDYWDEWTPPPDISAVKISSLF